MKKLYVMVVSCCLVLVGCSSNKLAKIKDSNNYKWQQYMNEDEFNQLKNGLSYMEVVEIVGGEGELLGENQYVWSDEILMTQAYEITFENDQLSKKEIVERRGASNRDKVEEESAKPE